MTRQEHLIQYLLEALKTNIGIEALFLKGSMASEIDDEYSDVDFYCLVKEEYYEEMLDMRETLLTAYMPIVYKSYVNFGNPQIVAIFQNNLHLDFYVIKEFKNKGTDHIKALYDPKELLSSYNHQKRIDSSETILDHLSDVIYTFHELDIAIRRRDNLWAMRLLSHMTADLSLVLCTLYDHHKPVRHMKGLYHLVDNANKEKIDSILSLMSPISINECTQEIIGLLESIIDEINIDISLKLDVKYLTFVKYNLFAE